LYFSNSKYGGPEGVKKGFSVKNLLPFVAFGRLMPVVLGRRMCY
jgi:hypothetical protein